MVLKIYLYLSTLRSDRGLVSIVYNIDGLLVSRTDPQKLNPIHRRVKNSGRNYA